MGKLDSQLTTPANALSRWSMHSFTTAPPDGIGLARFRLSSSVEHAGVHSQPPTPHAGTVVSILAPRNSGAAASEFIVPNPAPVRPLLLTLLALPILALAPAAFAKAPATAPASSPCADILHADHPKAYLTNGTLDAMVFLPDAKDGYYRGSRFDWSGVVPCLSYKGHTYFGEWFARYDPNIADAITGPVEEFSSEEGAIGFNQAKTGDTFVKIGIGTLRKTADGPYRYMAPYPVVDTGKRSVKIKARSIAFTQKLKGPNGVAYLYTKTLSLDSKGTGMNISHSLKNLGTTVIDTEVYEHNFYMLDKHPTGPAISFHFAFEPKPVRPLGPNAEIQGHDLVYLNELQPRQTVTSYLTGYSDKVSDYDITIQNRETKVGVQQTSDPPMSKLNFWSIRNTACPEAYVHLIILPGKTRRYTIHYRFFAD